MNEREYLICVSTYIPIGPVRLSLLKSYFGSAKRVWQANFSDLRKTGLSEKLTSGFIKHRNRFNPESYLARLRQNKITVLTKGQHGYPANLLDLEDAPVVLYVKGKIKKGDSFSIAVVGSRKMTLYGREVATKFCSDLARHGLTVVSGLARGVDTVAHETTLKSGGRTLAVLGCGLDRIYPPENTLLADKICQRGALISEYPLGYPPMPVNFVARNRIISGLAKGVLVVEGASRSGTLLTASHAAEQGRTVFAVPGQIFSPLSEAPFFLIKSGAKMATEAHDILEELNIKDRITKSFRRRKKSTS
jgi:DNA processing protein